MLIFGLQTKKLRTVKTVITDEYCTITELAMEHMIVIMVLGSGIYAAHKKRIL